MLLKNLYRGGFLFVLLAVISAIYFFDWKKESSVAAQIINSKQSESEFSPKSPKILSRKKWKAKDAIGKMKPHTIRYITIHHTAFPQKPELALEKKMQNLQSFSQSANRLASGKEKPAWADIPYHYYIAADGQIAEGREIDFAGDSNTDYDTTGHALIVLEGNFQTEKPSAGQIESLELMVFWLADRYKVSASEIKGHNDYASTGCPGVNLKNLLAPLRQKVRENKNPV